MSNLNRKISNQAQQIAGNLGYRMPTAFDQEREEFEKSQNNALTKSLSLEEAPPKEKHVRTLIMGTYKTRGPDVFWQKLSSNVPLFGNEIVTWKFCIVFHRLMQDGEAKVISGSIRHSSLIDQVCTSHFQTSSYGQLVGQYGKMILDKLIFHNKNKNIPGHFGLKNEQLERIEAGDMFELGVDFLDQMENTVQLMQAVFNSFEKGNKSVSLTKEGQCRLAALIPCTHDTSRLLELTTNLMRLLHLAIPWDSLDGHRTRFREVHLRLRRLYEEMSNLIFMRSMVQIPRLSEDLSIFFQTLRNISMSENRSVEEFEIQTFDPRPPQQPDDLISVADDSSLAYIQQEYSDLSSKYQWVLKMLEEKQHETAKELEEHSKRQQLLELELETMRGQLTEATSEAGDGKLEKLKAAYQKLRSDHIATLRQKGESEKMLKASEKRSQSVEAVLREFFQRHEVDYNDLEPALDVLNQKLDTLQVSLVSKDSALRVLNEAKNKVAANQEKLEAIDQLLRQRSLSEPTELAKKMAELDNLHQQWTLELEWKVDHLRGHDLDSLFEPPLDYAAEVGKTLASSDRFLSILMLTLLRFLPYNDEIERLFDLVLNLTEAIAKKRPCQDLWEQFKSEAKHQMALCCKENEVNVEAEIKKMQDSVDAAAATMEKLMVAARANEAKKKDIDVDLKILDSCCNLIEAIEVLIRAARELQAEITAQSGTNVREFYQKNHKWSQGLISAAKDIGSGAKCLVEAADGVLGGTAKFEELMVASNLITASTAQMVLASRVKAQKHSLKLEQLTSTSKSVAEATAKVIATCRASIQLASEDELDLMSLSVHQSKRLEMEVQIRVLELEAQLEKQRKKLFVIRKHQYTKNANQTEAEAEES